MYRKVPRSRVRLDHGTGYMHTGMLFDPQRIGHKRDKTSKVMRPPLGTPLERYFNIFFMFLFSGMAYALMTWRLGFSCGFWKDVEWFCLNFDVIWAEEAIEMVFEKILRRQIYQAVQSRGVHMVLPFHFLVATKY
jgi:hypothetical protein